MNLKIVEKSEFTFSDFEKGLMLAGLIAPANAAELQERECLERYEAQQKAESAKLYFKRAVLAAKIGEELSAEPTFGRVKFQKLVYICEHAAKMNVEKRYNKLAAGPFDPKFMHSIEKEFQKQKWFTVEKTWVDKYNRSKYIPLPDLEKYKKYYSNYFQHEQDLINGIIDLFRTVTTAQAEIAATLLACSVELSDNSKELSQANMLESFYNWSKEKSKFSERYVLWVWRWMKDNNLMN